ncbi:MAG: anti-sigma factor family protein, partial [Flammeovirgaceae bacterium]
KIWVLRELPENERVQVLAHAEHCKSCAAQLAQAKKLHALMADLAPAEPVNAGLLTSKVMQAIASTPASRPSALEWLLSYGLRGISMALVIWFSAEQVPPDQLIKRIPGSRTVVLNTSKFFDAYRDGRATKPVSFYARYQQIKQSQ